MYTLRALLVLLCASLLGLSASALPHRTSPAPGLYSPATTIDFPQPASPAYAGTSVTLNAVASNGMPVSYAVISGPGTIVAGSSTLTFTGVGTVVVEASQSGGTEAPAPVRATVESKLLTMPLTVASPSITTIVTFLRAGTVGSIRAASQGAASLDFTLAQDPSSTCAAGATYSAGDTCTVSFIFTPRRPGLRFGGIALSSTNGDLLANSYIVGVGTGPQILFNPPNQISVGSGFGGLSGVAVDGSGNVYGSDIVGGGVYQVAAGTGTIRQIATTPSTTDVFVDGSGNVFYADRQNVYEILAVDGLIPTNPTIRTLATGFITIDGIKVDAFGNVYVAEAASSPTTSTIAELIAVNGSIPTLTTPHIVASSVGSPTGVAVDISGNIYFSDENNHSLEEIAATNGVINDPVITVVSSAFNVPTNVTIDVSGNVYVPDFGTHNVRELLAVNGVLSANPVIIDRGEKLVSPQGVAVDASGNLYVADSGLGAVVELEYGAPPTLNFVATQIDQISSDSPQTVSIMNGGNADLVVPSPPLGTNPSITQSFTIDPSTDCPVLTPGSPSGTLAQGASCSFAIDFKPVTQGAIQGELVNTDNNQGVDGSTQTVLLNATGLGIPPAITFVVPGHTFGDPPFTVAASSNSAGAFTYTVVSGPATVVGATVSLTGAGTVVLRVSQAADGNYSAGQLDAAFEVGKRSQVITFSQPPSPVPYNYGPVSLQATASSGLPVNVHVLSGPAQVTGNILSLLGGGTVLLAADQAGDANTLPATQVRATIVVTFGPAAVALTGTPNSVFITNPVQVIAVITGGGGSPTGSVRFVEGNATLGTALISGNSATLATTSLGLGAHTITALYLGDADFAPVQSSTISVLVEDFRLTISDSTIVIDHGGVATYSLNLSPVDGATMPSDVQFTVQGGPQYSTSAFSPQVVRAGSGPVTVTLSVQTPNFPTGQASQFVAPSVGTRFGVLSFAAIVIGCWRKRKRIGRNWYLTITLLLAAAGCSLLTGCGSGWRSQFWTLSVIARSGNLSHGVAATLTSRCHDGNDACAVQ